MLYISIYLLLFDYVVLREMNNRRAGAANSHTRAYPSMSLSLSSQRPLLTDLISRITSTRDFLRLLLDSRRTSSSLHYLAKLFTYAFYLLLLLNARSLPLAWHIRVFRPVFAIKLRHRWLKLRTALMSRQQKDIEEDIWLDRLCPVGQDPFDTVVSYTSWASESSPFVSMQHLDWIPSMLQVLTTVTLMVI